MIFRRRWLLVVSALILSCGQLFAAASREDRTFAAAAKAFRDGIYDRAESGFAEFAQQFPKSPRLAEAVLLQAQAQLKQGKNTAAIVTLTTTGVNPGSLADRYAYWLGEARFAQGDFDRAAEVFTSFLNDFPGSPLRLTAAVDGAAALERLGDWPRMETLLGDTNGVFARLAAVNATNELVSRGWMLLANAQFEQKKFPEALATLGRMTPAASPPGLDWQRANLLCRVQAAAGDWDAALATTTNLLGLARVQDAVRLADSVAWHGTVLERLGRWEDAGAAWSENLTNTAPPEWQREAVLRMAGAAMARTNFTDAEASLEKYLVQFTNPPAADLAALTLGELHLREYVSDPKATNQLVLAQVRFEPLVMVSNNPSLAGKARLDRGWCYWLAARSAEDAGDLKGASKCTTNSLADFQAAAELLPFSEDLAVAKFKTGDALFALKDYSAARDSYQAVLLQFSHVAPVMKALGDRALYQILRANLELTNAAGADMAMRVMLEKFPASHLADSGMLLLGEGYSDFGSVSNALKTFRDFAILFPESVLTPQVELARARTYERQQDWTNAVASYESWLKSFPTNDLHPQVEYALGRASSQAGDDARAFGVFTNFVAQHPTNALAPLAQWWVADSYFRTGTNFAEAELNYELIFQTPAWRGSDLYSRAKLMASRAAVGRQGYADAANYLVALLTNCPPDFKNEAMFAYGGVLMRMESADTNRPFANFEEATNVFLRIYQENPTNAEGALALSELGDCCLQLGVFDAATNAYAQVVDSPFAAAGLRGRAMVGLGRALEMKAESAPPEGRNELLKAALEKYRDVRYQKESVGDPFWIKKAGLLELPLAIKLKDGDVDKIIDSLESELPELKEALEKKRAALGAPKN